MISSSVLKKFGRARGADLVGIASAAALNEGAPRGHRPEDILPGAKIVLVLGMKWLNTVIDESIPTYRPIYAASQRVLNGRLDGLAWQVASFLEEKGFRAMPIPTLGFSMSRLMGILSYRHAAVEAGIGHLGKNNLLITPQFGPRQRFTAIISDAPLKNDNRSRTNICEKTIPVCKYACVKVCPVSALKENENTDKPKCMHYQDYTLPRYSLERSVMQCGLCVTACPVGAKYHAIRGQGELAELSW